MFQAWDTQHPGHCGSGCFSTSCAGYWINLKMCRSLGTHLAVPCESAHELHSSPLSFPCLPVNVSANKHHDERGRQQESMKEDFQGKRNVSHKLYTRTSQIYSDMVWLPSHLHTLGVGSLASSLMPSVPSPWPRPLLDWWKIRIHLEEFAFPWEK